MAINQAKIGGTTFLVFTFALNHGEQTILNQHEQTIASNCLKFGGDHLLESTPWLNQQLQVEAKPLLTLLEAKQLVGLPPQRSPGWRNEVPRALPARCLDRGFSGEV